MHMSSRRASLSASPCSPPHGGAGATGPRRRLGNATYCCSVDRPDWPGEGFFARRRWRPRRPVVGDAGASAEGGPAGVDEAIRGPLHTVAWRCATAE